MRINRVAYAAIHSLQYCEYKQSLDKSRPMSWSKVLAIQAMLRTHSYVAAIDADCIIRNPLVSIAAIFALYPSADNIHTPDYGNKRLNGGVIFVRNSSYSVRYWNRIYHQPRETIFSAIWEQKAIIDHMISRPAEFSEHSKIVRQENLNFVAGWKDLANGKSVAPGEARKTPDFVFIQHAAGGTRGARATQKYNMLAKESCDNSGFDVWHTVEPEVPEQARAQAKTIQN